MAISESTPDSTLRIQAGDEWQKLLLFANSSHPDLTPTPPFSVFLKVSNFSTNQAPLNTSSTSTRGSSPPVTSGIPLGPSDCWSLLRVSVTLATPFRYSAALGSSTTRILCLRRTGSLPLLIKHWAFTLMYWDVGLFLTPTPSSPCLAVLGRLIPAKCVTGRPLSMDAIKFWPFRTR